MNYAPNTTRWAPGDLVIHDADAKRPDMLMRVVGYTKRGECQTRYVDEARWGRKLWANDLKYLHDPARFGIALPALNGIATSAIIQF